MTDYINDSLDDLAEAEAQDEKSNFGKKIGKLAAAARALRSKVNSDQVDIDDSTTLVEYVTELLKGGNKAIIARKPLELGSPGPLAIGGSSTPPEIEAVIGNIRSTLVGLNEDGRKVMLESINSLLTGKLVDQVVQELQRQLREAQQELLVYAPLKRWLKLSDSARLEREQPVQDAIDNVVDQAHTHIDKNVKDENATLKTSLDAANKLIDKVKGALNPPRFGRDWTFRFARGTFDDTESKRLGLDNV